MGYMAQEEENIDGYLLHVWCPYTGIEGRTAIEVYKKRKSEGDTSHALAEYAKEYCCLGRNCPKAYVKYYNYHSVYKDKTQYEIFCGGNWQK